MIALLISFVLIKFFAEEAQQHGKNVLKWVLLGFGSFWLTAVIPTIVLMEGWLGERTDAAGIALSTLFVFGFLGLGGYISLRVFQKIAPASEAQTPPTSSQT